MTAQEIFELAQCYEHGTNGVEKDKEKFVELLKEAAALDHVEAAYCLGCLYEWDEPEEAYKYYFAAADHCHVKAMRRVSLMTEEGRGCTPDPALAHALWPHWADK